MKIVKRIKVTKNSIHRGIREDGGSCPIARGMKRTGLQDVHVDGFDISFCYRDHYYEMKTPKVASNFINVFDDYTIPKRKHKPFSFNLTFNTK